MKPITFRSLAAMASAAALAASTGCATISTSQVGALDGVSVKGANGAPVEHVWLGTTGDYLFWSIPLGSGRFRWNEETKQLETETAWFKDCVGFAEIQDALLKYANGRNCDVVDVMYFDADTSYGVASYEGILGFLYGTSRMGVSAVLIPRNNTADK